MSVRTYNPSVLIGNWNEDIQLEEDRLKEFLEKKARGELLIQKSGALQTAVSQRVDLSVSRDAKVHFGDVVMIVNGGNTSLAVSATTSTPGGGCGVAASSANSGPTARTAFAIVSKDGSPPGDTLKYGIPFYLCTASSVGEGASCEPLFLFSDSGSFAKCAKKSRHNDVSLVNEPSFLTEWKVQPHNPQFRMELEYSDVPANEKIILTHVKTHVNLNLEKEYAIKTPFGMETEMSCHTSLDSHKAERDTNHWMLMMSVPGDRTMPVEQPTDTQAQQWL